MEVQKRKSLILTLVVSALVVVTLLMPVSLGSGYSPVIANLFGNSSAVFVMARAIAKAFCDIFGASTNSKLVNITAYAMYISQLVLILIATIQLVLSIISLASKKIIAGYRTISSIAKYILIVCVIFIFVSTMVFILQSIDGSSFFELIVQMGYIYILWTITSIWLFVRLIRMDKYLKN